VPINLDIECENQTASSSATMYRLLNNERHTHMTAHANALYVRRLKGFSNSIREYVNGLEV
jgi:hypothetical protein